MTERQRLVVAGAGVAALLLVAYISTLAPDVTFWDSGEFIAAAKTLGIPHPPGTPLYVFGLNAWGRLWPFLPYAVRTNLFSAACTAGAAALSCFLVGRFLRDWVAGATAALTAGAMSTVWQNANETEVYAAALLLAVAAIFAAEWGGRTRSARGVLLSAYLLALAVPVHLSALVAAPATVYLASTDVESGRVDVALALLLTGSALIVAGAGLVSWPIALVGAAVVVAGGVRGPAARFGGRTWPLALCGIVLLGLSATLLLLVRSRFDPAINQANPSTMAQLGYAISRRQYAVAALLPRQAPVWIQLANWFEYADWQFGLALAPTAVPSVGRILVTVAFGGLGLFGSSVHRRRDHRTWVGLLILFVCGSLGIIAYLNFKAGASFAWSFLPDAADHEARDRDYFFVLGFWTWGLWAGIGAVALAGRVLRSPAAGLLVAGLPVALNWQPSRRNEWPEAGLPREVAAALLQPAPRDAVLFVAGDNDTYPLWFLQQVEGIRRDVTVVTIPLLDAPWYRDELQRRWRLWSGPSPRDLAGMTKDVAAAARAMGRPIAVALTVPSTDRWQLGDRWRLKGLIGTEDRRSPVAANAGGHLWTIDTATTQWWAESIDRWTRGQSVHQSTDPVSEHFLDVLACPRRILSSRPGPSSLSSLDSTCNF